MFTAGGIDGLQIERDQCPTISRSLQRNAPSSSVLNDDFQQGNRTSYGRGVLRWTMDDSERIDSLTFPIAAFRLSFAFLSNPTDRPTGENCSSEGRKKERKKIHLPSGASFQGIDSVRISGLLDPSMNRREYREYSAQSFNVRASYSNFRGPLLLKKVSCTGRTFLEFQRSTRGGGRFARVSNFSDPCNGIAE